MTLQEIEIKKTEMQTELFNEVGLFWAFSNEQFDKNKTPLGESDKYMSFPGGGYFPKNNKNVLKEGLEKIHAFGRDQVKSAKLQEEEILRQLYNRECFYICDATEVINMFAGIYTKQQILNVFANNFYKAMQEN